jgi:hypothetical protein
MDARISEETTVKRRVLERKLPLLNSYLLNRYIKKAIYG